MAPSTIDNGPSLLNLETGVFFNIDAVALPLQNAFAGKKVAAMATDQIKNNHQAQNGAIKKELAVQHAGPSHTIPQDSSAASVSDHGDGAEASAPRPPPPELPDKVEVVCGTARGVLDLKRLLVTCDGVVFLITPAFPCARRMPAWVTQLPTLA